MDPPRGTLSPKRAAVLENRGTLDILDIGCGEAKGRGFLTERGHRYVGVDLRSPQADIRCDAHVLPFADQQFDAVLLFSVLQYTLQPQVMLNEARRVLRPGGTLTGSVAFLEPGVWGSFMHLSPLGLVALLELTCFHLEYIWPSWSVIEAVSCAIRQRPGAFAGKKSSAEKIERLGRSSNKMFRETLDFSAAVNFHASRVSAPPRP